MAKWIIGLPILLTFSFPANPTILGDQPQLSATEIINKHLEAVGGKQALTKFKSRVAIGTVSKENEPNVRMAIMSESPNRVSAIYVFEKFDWQLSFDGKNPIIHPLIFPRDFAPIQDKYQEMLASGLMFNSISLYNILTASESYGTKLEAKGTKKIKDRVTYVVELKRAKGATARLYFDAETFMWIRTEYGRASLSKSIQPFTNDVVPHGDDELTVDFYFETSDFRDVDGVKLPFKFEQVVTYPILRHKRAGTMSGTISEYQHNVPIDPKMFQ